MRHIISKSAALAKILPVSQNRRGSSRVITAKGSSKVRRVAKCGSSSTTITLASALSTRCSQGSLQHLSRRLASAKKHVRPIGLLQPIGQVIWAVRPIQARGDNAWLIPNSVKPSSVLCGKVEIKQHNIGMVPIDPIPGCR